MGGIMSSKILKYFLLFFSVTAFAQTEISGKITSAGGEILSGASVLLKDKDQKIVAYAISGNSGGYELAAKAPGEYTLEVSFLGYEKQVETVTVAAETKNIRKDFVLKEGNTVLKEVVIEAEAPVKRQGDTLVYDAKALSTGREAVVEDLLKNIPGITIQADGTIKYGDKEVEKVMVGGDDLFNKGYSLLTKNMPTEPLDKVEVLRNYSKNRLLKGVEDSDGVALNLTIDEEFKNIWFGNLLAGYGNDERYRIKGNLMNFNKRYKNFFTTNFNNAGYDDVGNVAGMQYSSSDIETIGMGSRAVQVMSLGGKVSRIDENRTRFNNAKTGSFSSIWPLGTKAKLRVNGFVGFDDLKTYQSSQIVRDFGDTYFENDEVNNSDTDIKKAYVSAFINYDISATRMLQTLSTFNSGNTDFKNDLTFNGTGTREELETRNTYFDQQLTYTYKWKNRNVVLLKGRFLTDRLPQNYGINDYLMGDLFTYDDINAIGNKVKSSREYAGLQADFRLKQKNNDLIAFKLGFDNNNDDLATRFSLFTATGAVNPDGFQADAAYNVGDLYANGGYSWKFEKITLGADVNMHQLFNHFENIGGEVSTQKPFFVNPALNFIWELKPDNMVSASYRYNVTNADLIQVNDAYLLTSSRSFSKGLGYFNQLESSSANVGFSTKHYLNRYGFSVGLNYSKQNDVISYRSQLEQNSSLSEAFVMRGGDNIGITLNSHVVVKKLKGTLGVEARVLKSIYYNEVNGSGLRKNILYSQVYNVNWRSSFKGDFNFGLASELNFSKVKSDYTFDNTSIYSTLDLIYNATDELSFKVKGEHYNFGGLDKHNNYLFADLEALYSFKKDKYAIILDGRNLFNTNMFTTYTVSDVGYSTSSFRLLPAYVMASFRFRF
jgi:hypothetical protein